MERAGHGHPSGQGNGGGDWFPPIEPRRQGMLDVGDGHSLYWEESGAPDGLPVIFVHGGPGAGCAPGYRRFFDPKRTRIILFDQRGAGRSRPYADITANTTDHLIADMERLREHLGVDRWLLFGGSWGSTLALAYGQTHPDRCLGFVLRGIFLFRAREVEWFLSGMGRLFPEAAQAFTNHLPPDERATLLPSYTHRLCDPDPAIHGPAARAWSAYEEACSRLVPRPSLGPSAGSDNLAMARLEAHYMMHNGFLDEGQLLTRIDRVQALPCTIVQGRYDIVCPPESAYALHQAWPGSILHMIPDAGHSALEPGTRNALLAAMRKATAAQDK